MRRCPTAHSRHGLLTRDKLSSTPVPNASMFTVLSCTHIALHTVLTIIASTSLAACPISLTTVQGARNLHVSHSDVPRPLLLHVIANRSGWCRLCLLASYQRLSLPHETKYRFPGHVGGRLYPTPTLHVARLEAACMCAHTLTVYYTWVHP